jgi:uncharacterized membrane protein YkvA (DUF1232 family)
MTFFDRVRRVGALLADPKVAKLPRLAVILAAVYLVSPVDLFPDFLVPVAGYLDDLLVVWAAVKWLLGSAPSTGLTRAGSPPPGDGSKTGG